MLSLSSLEWSGAMATLSLWDQTPPHLAAIRAWASLDGGIVGGFHTVKKKSTAKFILSLPRLQGLQTWKLAKGCFWGCGLSKFLVCSSTENSHGRLTSHSISRTFSRPVIKHISVFKEKVIP